MRPQAQANTMLHLRPLELNMENFLSNRGRNLREILLMGWVQAIMNWKMGFRQLRMGTVLGANKIRRGLRGVNSTTVFIWVAVRLLDLQRLTGSTIPRRTSQAQVTTQILIRGSPNRRARGSSLLKTQGWSTDSKRIRANSSRGLACTTKTQVWARMDPNSHLATNPIGKITPSLQGRAITMEI